MACALLRVVGIGVHLGLSHATSIVQTSRVTCVLKSSFRICSTVQKLQHSDTIPVQQESSGVPRDAGATKQVDLSAETLLKSISVRELSGYEATSILKELSKLAKDENGITDGITLFNDNRFVVLCSVLDKKVAQLRDATLISTLKALILLGIPTNDKVIESVETQILWRIRRMSMHQLISLFVFIVDHQASDLQQRVLHEVQAKLQQRWCEILEPGAFRLLFRHTAHFPVEFNQKLEDRVISFVENGWSADELQKTIVSLAEQKLRSTHLLRSITYHLTKHSERLGLKAIADLISSMNILNYVDHPLFQRLSDEMLVDLPGIENPAHVADAVAAVGYLRWRHSALMEAFSDWFLKNIACCNGSHLVAYVVALAQLQYEVSSGVVDEESEESSERLSTVLDAILPVVTKDKISGDIAWLNFIWSLAIIRRLDLSQGQFVLDKSFYRCLLELPGYQSVVVKKKLLNIHSVAKWELGHMEPLPQEFVGSHELFDQTKSNPLRTSVFDTLCIYLPMGKFLKCNKWTQSGVFVDAEFVLDKDGRPLPVDDYTTYFGDVESHKPLPSGAHRLALLIHDFKDFTLNNVALTGLASLRIRILKNSGYKVVGIPYSEYSIVAPTLKRLQYLQLKIHSAIGITTRTTLP